MLIQTQPSKAAAAKAGGPAIKPAKAGRGSAEATTRRHSAKATSANATDRSIGLNNGMYGSGAVLPSAQAVPVSAPR